MTIRSIHHLGDVIRDVHEFDPKAWQGDKMKSDSLVQSVQNFFAILDERKIRYVLAGGIALLYYIDILLSRNPLFKRVQQKYSKVQLFFDQEIPLVTVEGLILLKLYALPSLYRQGNFYRVSICEMILPHYFMHTNPIAFIDQGIIQVRERIRSRCNK
jgi:hypothetical protein